MVKINKKPKIESSPSLGFSCTHFLVNGLIQELVYNVHRVVKTLLTSTATNIIQNISIKNVSVVQTNTTAFGKLKNLLSFIFSSSKRDRHTKIKCDKMKLIKENSLKK